MQSARWLPEVMARTYAIEPGFVGQVLGTSTIVINTLGIFVSAASAITSAARAIPTRRSGCASGVAVAVVATSALPAFMPTANARPDHDVHRRLPFHGYVAMGPMAVNQVTPNQMRAQVLLVYLFTVNLIGIGLGPQSRR
jgi:hypothetical protein